MSKIQITTNRLSLQPLGLNYLESTHAYATDLENTRYMMHLPNENKEETIQFLSDVEKEWNAEEQTDYEFAILLNDIHIGAISLYVDENNIGELGYIIDKRYWGQGYTTEAAKALMEYAITELGIKHFVATCDSENIGSYKIMERLGMQLKERNLGRRNRSSNELREELVYEFVI